jgi:hypothetical protein
MKQTAVEWLIEQLFGDNEIIGCSDEILEQALEMEKHQIENAYDHCRCIGNFDSGTEYYDETFKKDKL